MPKQVTNVASDDALTTIYRLSHDEHEEVIAARVAERLDIRPASVAGMLSRLARDRLVAVDGRKRIALTKVGFARAEHMVRRHRLAECLLVETLKLEWWRAYEEAHLLEHGISDLTETHLFEALGRPSRSPFGYPIPGPNAPELSMLSLADVAEQAEVIIDRVFEEDEQLLRFFYEEGFLPDQRVTVILGEPYRGTMTVQVFREPVVIGTLVAQRIWVRPAS